MRLDQDIGLKKLPGLNAFVLHKEEVEVLHEMIEPYIARSVAHSFGTVSTPKIMQYLLNGDATAVILIENDHLVAVFAVMIIPYAEYRACRIIAASGRKMDEAMKRIDVLITWALKKGATEIEGWCRPSVTRLLRRHGFRPRFSIVTLDIKRSMQ